MTTNENTLSSRSFLQEMFTANMHKKNQGKMVRQITCLAIWIAIAAGVWRFHLLVLSPNMGGGGASYVIAALIGAAGLWFGYRLVNWPKFADFLISVEAELNKVSWPSWRELNRASLVVIFTIFFMATILFTYDFIWQLIFSWLRVS